MACLIAHNIPDINHYQLAAGAKEAAVRGDTLRTTWIVVLAALVAAIVGLEAIGIDVTLGMRAVSLSSCIALVLYLSFVRPPSTAWVQQLLDMCNGLMLFAAISLSGALLSYIVLRVTPFADADPLLHRADLALGLDWRATYDAYRQYPTLGTIMRKLYLAIFWIPLLVMLSLAATGQLRAMHKFIASFGVALAVTLVVFAFFPAITPVFYLLGENVPYVPGGGLGYYPAITALRSGALDEVDLQAVHGLITFPSFHAASAVIFAWATWSVRVYRWPLAAINAGMLIATPIEGAHYFIDLIGGVAIAVLAIALVHHFERRRPAHPADTSPEPAAETGPVLAGS